MHARRTTRPAANLRRMGHPVRAPAASFLRHFRVPRDAFLPGKQGLPAARAGPIFRLGRKSPSTSGRLMPAAEDFRFCPNRISPHPEAGLTRPNLGRFCGSMIPISVLRGVQAFESKHLPATAVSNQWVESRKGPLPGVFLSPDFPSNQVQQPRAKTRLHGFAFRVL